MPTVSESQTILSRYAGANNTYLARLNEVRARLIQSGNWEKDEITLPVYADAQGLSIVSVDRRDSILAGALSNSSVLCSGNPLGVSNGWSQFDKMGLGYGGLTQDFTEVFGEFAVFNEWTDPMRIRLRPEVSETAIIYLKGTLANREVWALNGATWEAREKLTLSGTSAITSTQYFEAEGFRAKKAATTGRIFVYSLDDAGVETLIAIWGTETLPRYRRYRVPQCEDVSPVEESSGESQGGSYSRAQFDAMFSDAGEVTVSTTATTDLSYVAFFLKTLRVIASAGTYAHSFTLDTTNPKSGAVFRLSLELAASAGITINVYNESTGGTLLRQVVGDSSNATYLTLIFSFNGTAWRYAGSESL